MSCAAQARSSTTCSATPARHALQHSGCTPAAVGMVTDMFIFRSRWMLLTIVVPVGAWFLGKLADSVERRSGPSSLTAALHWPQERRQHAGTPVAA